MNFFGAEFLKHKSARVNDCEDEFSLQPIIDLFVTLASYWILRCRLTLFELNGERARPNRVVVTLNAYEPRFKALKLLVVKFDVTHSILMQIIKYRILRVV